jgi:hypothetical protein
MRVRAQDLTCAQARRLHCAAGATECAAASQAESAADACSGRSEVPKVGPPRRTIAVRLQDSPLSARPSRTTTRRAAGPGHPFARRAASSATTTPAVGGCASVAREPTASSHEDTSNRGAGCVRPAVGSAHPPPRRRLEPPAGVSTTVRARRHGQPIDHHDVVRMRRCGRATGRRPPAGAPVERHVGPLGMAASRSSVSPPRRRHGGQGEDPERRRRMSSSL